MGEEEEGERGGREHDIGREKRGRRRNPGSARNT